VARLLARCWCRIEEGKHYMDTIKRLLSMSKLSTVTKAMNVLPLEQVFFKWYNAAWPFQGEPSSDHAMPTAAVYSVRECS
jgi:hypothetical protein